MSSQARHVSDSEASEANVAEAVKAFGLLELS